MGSAASQASLTKEQKELITQKLKVIYESNAASLGSQELGKLLEAEFARLLGSFTRLNESNQESVKIMKSSSVDQGEISSSIKNNPKSSKNTSGSRTRRRSFDNSQVSKLTSRPASKTNSNSKNTAATVATTTATAAATTTVTVEDDKQRVLISQSEGALQVTPENIAVDSWDSVVQQPFCELCKMAFKSMAFFERHVKYSSLHADNVAKQAKGEITNLLLSPVKSSAVSPTKGAIREMIKQEEGVHYRLLYSGAKFFWRTQDSLDFDIYHHFLPHCIEIVPFNVTKQKELPRIYLEYDSTKQNVQGIIEGELEARKKENSNNRFADAFTDRQLQEIREEITLQKIVTYILQRLRFDGSHSTSTVCDFAALHADDESHFPVLEQAPRVLIPLPVHRRRRSSHAEMNDSMRHLQSDQKIISETLEKATQLTDHHLHMNHDGTTNANTAANLEYSAKIAHIVYTAVVYLLDRNRKRYAAHSPRMQKFYLLLEKIMHRNAVKKTRAFLDHRGITHIIGSPNRKKSVKSLLV